MFQWRFSTPRTSLQMIVFWGFFQHHGSAGRGWQLRCRLWRPDHMTCRIVLLCMEGTQMPRPKGQRYTECGGTWDNNDTRNVMNRSKVEVFFFKRFWGSPPFFTCRSRITYGCLNHGRCLPLPSKRHSKIAGQADVLVPGRPIRRPRPLLRVPIGLHGNGRDTHGNLGGVPTLQGSV